jgi:hypothetical protein
MNLYKLQVNIPRYTGIQTRAKTGAGKHETFVTVLAAGKGIYTKGKDKTGINFEVVLNYKN